MDNEANGTAQRYPRGQHPRSMARRFQPGNKAAAGKREPAVRADWVDEWADVSLRDMLYWVMNSLGVRKPMGAPCPGAIALWQWAREDQNRFWKFAFTKLLPMELKAAGKNKPAPKRDEVESEDEYLAMLDKLKPEGGAKGGEDEPRGPVEEGVNRGCGSSTGQADRATKGLP